LSAVVVLGIVIIVVVMAKVKQQESVGVGGKLSYAGHKHLEVTAQRRYKVRGWCFSCGREDCCHCCVVGAVLSYCWLMGKVAGGVPSCGC